MDSGDLGERLSISRAVAWIVSQIKCFIKSQHQTAYAKSRQTHEKKRKKSHRREERSTTDDQCVP